MAAKFMQYANLVDEISNTEKQYEKLIQVLSSNNKQREAEKCRNILAELGMLKRKVQSLDNWKVS